MPTTQITLGDILKAEADQRSRIAITAPKGTRLGMWIDHPTRKQKIVALSDEEYGKVLIQPHNCTISLDKIGLPTGVTFDALSKQGDAHGILYTKILAELPSPIEADMTNEVSGGTSEVSGQNSAVIGN